MGCLINRSFLIGYDQLKLVVTGSPTSKYNLVPELQILSSQTGIDNPQFIITNSFRTVDNNKIADISGLGSFNYCVDLCISSDGYNTQKAKYGILKHGSNMEEGSVGQPFNDFIVIMDSIPPNIIFTGRPLILEELGKPRTPFINATDPRHTKLCHSRANDCKQTRSKRATH